MNTLILVHCYCAVFLTGLIWVVQLVHYPSFEFVEESCFVEFSGFHSRRISFIVIPMMLLELASGLFLAVQHPDSMFWILNFIFIIGIWFSTLLLSIPCHHKFSNGKDLSIIRRLVVTNWPRTILWSVKSFLLVFAV